MIYASGVLLIDFYYSIKQKGSNVLLVIWNQFKLSQGMFQYLNIDFWNVKFNFRE